MTDKTLHERRFRNRIAIVFNLEMHELVDAAVIEPSPDGLPDYKAMQADPLRWVLRLDDKRLRRLYLLVESRQPADLKLDNQEKDLETHDRTDG